MIKIKRRLIFLITLLGLALLLTGCSSSKSERDKATTDKTATKKTSDNSATVFGQIESIDGSKLTIALATQPERGERQPNNNKSNDTSTSNSNSAAEQSSNPGSAAGNGAPPAGGPDGNKGDGNQGGPGPGGSPPGNGGGQGPQLELTGEKQTITVADDTVIESGRPAKAENNDETATELSLSDLKAGMIVQITLTSDSTDTAKTAATIRVMSQAGQQGQSDQPQEQQQQ